MSSVQFVAWLGAQSFTSVKRHSENMEVGDSCQLPVEEERLHFAFQPGP